MINFRDRDDFLPSLVSVSALIVIAGTALFMVLVPKPTTAGMSQKLLAAKKPLLTKIAISHQDTDNANQYLANRTWTGDAEQITTTSARKANDIAQKRGVKISVFRPQRDDKEDNVNVIPFLLTVDGPFPSVLAFERDLDVEENKLGISNVQISSSDPNSDHVTANINVVAYLNPAAQAAAAAALASDQADADKNSKKNPPIKSTKTLTTPPKEKTNRA